MKKLVAIKTGSSIFFVFALIFILGLSISLQSLLADWTVPSAIPPDGNMLKPVNIGTSTDDMQTVLGMFGASTIAATGNLGANKVITPELCLNGDCKTTWPEGGSSDTGDSVKVWVNSGNTVTTNTKYEINNPFSTTSINVQIFWTDVKNEEYLRECNWQQDYFSATQVMSMGALVKIKADKIEIYSGASATYWHYGGEGSSVGGYYFAVITQGVGDGSSNSSGSSEGDTMVPGWPDAITCNITNPPYENAILYLETSANVMWYVMPYNPEDVRITFNLDGTFNNKYGITTTDCQGLSISQLYSQGKAFNFVGGGSSIPAGTISAFNLTTCPTGWSPADGTNGTPDLRGVFIRGMETFNGGTSYNDRDPDRSGSDTLKSYQADAFASHYHQTVLRTGSGDGGSTFAGNYIPSGYINTTSAGGNETRPKNVALIYCMKTNTETPQVSLWTKNNDDVYYNEGNVSIGTTTSFTYNGDVERNLVIYSPTASRNTNFNMVYNGGADCQGSIIEATNLSNTYADKRIAQINLYNPLGSDQNKGVIEFLVWDDGSYNTTLKINKTGLEVNGTVTATDVCTSGGKCLSASSGMTCVDLPSPSVGGLPIGDSEWAWQNDISHKPSAQMYCEGNGYLMGNARDVWYTGDGQCYIYQGGGWGLSHHCYAISSLRCCK